ncbi:hypothetical protein [Brevibacillus reuszeri]|uniref:hypothetical protein n=1 Tax=Brevibacillus reuszeri TaxID=54915 RepID=UPI003D245354
MKWGKTLMAICVEFERVSSKGSLAYYRYGSCGHGDGLFELDYEDIDKMLLGSYDGNSMTMDKIVRVKKLASGEKEQHFLAMKAFTKIWRHYKETGEFLEVGGYYA